MSLFISILLARLLRLSNSSEFDYCSKEDVKHLQDKRCNLLKHFTNLYYEIQLFEIEIESDFCGDIIAYLDSLQEFLFKFKDAFDKYCMSHESLLNCQTLDLAVAERLKSSHSKVVNRFNEKRQSLISTMSMVACSTKQMSNPNLPGCNSLLNQTLPDCKLIEDPNFDCNPVGPENDVTTHRLRWKLKEPSKSKETAAKPLVKSSSLDGPPILTSQLQDLPSKPQHYLSTKSPKTSCIPGIPTMETEVRKVVKKASPHSRSVEKARLALEKAELIKKQKMMEAEVEAEMARIKYEEAVLSHRRKS